MPIEKAQTAGATPKEIYCHGLESVERGIRSELTRSASESSSCPISELRFRHRATLPSIKSKKSPKGMKVMAVHRFERSFGVPRQ